MADFDYYGADYGAERPSRLMGALRSFGAANWVGALTSLGLTAGMALWAVDLTFRDVSGVPVVRALEGPMRIAPEEPGGSVAPFQGLALADITSGGSAAPAPDEIVLAPPPVALDAPSLSERTAASEVAGASGAEAGEMDVAVEIEGTDTGLAGIAPEVGMAEPDAPARTVTIDPNAVEMALSEAMNDAIGAADGFDLGTVEAVPASVPGVTRSVRPTARPDGFLRVTSLPTDAPAQVTGVQVASLDAAMPTSGDVDPASLAAGTRVVQLGAFDSEAAALSEWARLEGQFGDYLVGRSRMIQKAASGGREFWRLRVSGFDEASDARRLCAELVAQDAACIPVTVR